MRRIDYLLIGGGLAASRATRQIRKHDPHGSILLVSDEPHLPYDRPPLSKEFLRGEQDSDGLFYDSASDLAARRVQTALRVRADDLDADRRVARLADGTSVRFDTALIATGGHPVRLDLPGCDLAGIHYLRTLDDAAALARAAAPGARAAIVGAGFIGLEAAASLTQLGVRVSVLEAAPRIWVRFAPEPLSQFVAAYCTARGVTFATGVTVTGFTGRDGRVTAVRTADGDDVACDFVLVAVGITPTADLAQAAGLAVDDGIVVNERMETSAAGIYAAGDVASYPDPHFGRRRRVEHWGHAEHTGQVAGANMAGADAIYDLLTYVWSDIFDLHLEFAGDETAHDSILLRGEPGPGGFTVLYLQNDRLTAYCSVGGPPKEFGPLQKLIKRRVDLSTKVSHVTDPGFPLKQLL